MEVKSQKDKSQLSSNDSSTYSWKSLKLGVYSKSRFKSTSSTTIKIDRGSRQKMLASMRKKVKINNIEVISKNNNRLSDPYHYKQQINISCFPQLSSTKQLESNIKNYLEYAQLVKKLKNSNNLVQNVHSIKGDKLACFEENCQIKRKWIRNIIFYEKELKNVYLLKQRKSSVPQQVITQIQKDVARTYSRNTITKIKLNLVQSDIQKYNLIDVLRNVLKLYAAYDPQVGYVQGMNMVAAPIIFHMKDTNSSFIYFKEVMNYGKLRLFFVDNFENIKSQVRQKFKKILKFHNFQLYNCFEKAQIDYTMFVPYYFSLFSTLIDIQYMVILLQYKHIVINEFMRGGVSFLHKLFLILLLYLKERIIQDRQYDGVIAKLGVSYIKSLDINWKNILVLTSEIHFT